MYRRWHCNESHSQQTDGGDVILLLVHYIPLDTKAEAIVAPLDDPMVHGTAILTVDNGRHEFHRHPDSCSYKHLVVVGYRNMVGEDTQTTHTPHVCIGDTRAVWVIYAMS